MIKKPAPIPAKNCLLNHYSSPHLVHAHSEHDITRTPVTSQNYRWA